MSPGLAKFMKFLNDLNDNFVEGYLLSYVQRVSNIIQNRAVKILKRYQDRTGAPVLGRLTVTRDRSNGYAKVFNDPEYIFADPGWRGEPPRYLMWVGESETEARHMMRTFKYALAHEAMHVVEEVLGNDGSRALAAPEHKIWPIDKNSKACLQELMIDRGAIDFCFSPKEKTALLWSMIGFSRLVLKDWSEGRLEAVCYSSVSRELAKLSWVSANEGLPTWLRQEAAKLCDDYWKIIAEKNTNWAEHKDAFCQLLDVYLQVFANTKVKIFLPSFTAEAVASYEAGTRCFEQADFTEAAELFKAALLQEPDFFPAREKLALSLALGGHYLESFQTAKLIFSHYSFIWEGMEKEYPELMPAEQFSSFYLQIGFLSAALAIVENRTAEAQDILDDLEMSVGDNGRISITLLRTLNSTGISSKLTRMNMESTISSCSLVVLGYFESEGYSQGMINLLRNLLKLAGYTRQPERYKRSLRISLVSVYITMLDRKSARALVTELLAEYPGDSEILALEESLANLARVN